MRQLWVDLTTTVQDAGRHAHGTLRVERGIVATLAERADPSIGFVAFDRAAGRFHELPAAQARQLATAPSQAERGRELAGVWTRRAWAMQGRLQRLVTRPARSRSADSPEPFGPADTLLLPGEHDRQDFAHLAALKRSGQLAVAFVFYDLLRVLDDGDERLHGDDVRALPPTDFLIREAALALPISRFSAAALHGHLARRGVTGCPVEPIRLAGELADADAAAKPVAGLRPGGFVLSVGDVVHRKNHALLARVWTDWAAQGGPVRPLVVAGRIDLEGNALVRAVRRDPALRGIIRFMPNLNDAALLWLYRNCRYTVFPSLREGFGLPVAESLGCGKVCVASSAQAIPEAGQGAAITLDPSDAASWIAQVLRLEDDAALAEEAARVARLFRPVTWRDTADGILAALKRHGLR